jgi:hypothetical protein
VRRAQDAIKSIGQRFIRHGTAADGDNAQTETQFQSDLSVVGSQYGKGAGADIAQPDNAYVNVFHGLLGYDTDMRDLTVRSRFRRQLVLLVPGILAAQVLGAQAKGPPQVPPLLDPNSEEKPGDIRLPNGKKQQDEILKADYEKNVKDARDLTDLARSFEEDLEKNEAFVFSLADLKKLDDMEKLTKRIRGRMKRF